MDQPKKRSGTTGVKTGAKRTPARTRGRADSVRSLLKKMERKLGEADAKVTLGDYIRLMQLQKELEEEEPKEIKVTWVEKTPERESGS
jgi:hypothetical protein